MSIQPHGETEQIGVIPDETALREALMFACVGNEWTGDILSAAKSLLNDQRDFEEWCRNRAAGREANHNKNIPKEWGVLHAVRQISRMRQRHAELGLPEDITSDTARDLAIWLDEVGGPKAPRRDFPHRWFDHHARGQLLRLGRLQFVPEVWAESFDVWAESPDGTRSVAFARGGIPCDADGWPVAEEPAFVTTRTESGGRLKAHVASAKDGSISREAVEFQTGSLLPLLGPGVKVLQVHIPAGEPLTLESCQDAFHRARRIFRQFFPEIKWRGFTCSSWMLDRELWKFLPPSSGIRQFAGLFSPLATRKGDDRQLIERVFGPVVTLDHFPVRTSLQGNILAHRRAGGVFRRTSGYFL